MKDGNGEEFTRLVKAVKVAEFVRDEHAEDYYAIRRRNPALP